MSEIKFSLGFECELSSSSIYSHKYLKQEDLAGYDIKSSGAGYIITSPFLSLTMLKKKTQKFLDILPKLGKLNSNKISYINVSNPLHDDIKFYNNLDYDFFKKLYPSLEDSILMKYKKIIVPQDFKLLHLNSNLGLHNFFSATDYECLPYKKKTKNSESFFSLRLIGREFKVKDLDEICNYLLGSVFDAYKGSKSKKYLKLIEDYNEINSDLYSYRLFKDKYKDVEIHHDLKFDTEYLRKVWVSMSENIKFLFWCNDFKKLKFDINWNSSTRKCEIRNLKGSDYYLKESDLFDSTIENSIFIDSVIRSANIKNCYFYNCVIIDSKINNSYLDKCFWNEDSTIDKKSYISKEKRTSKLLDISSDESEMILNYNN